MSSSSSDAHAPQEGLAAGGEHELAHVLESTQQKVIKGGSGKYIFDLEKLEHFDIGPHYSSAEGSAVSGERIQVVLVHKRRGTVSRLHTHPNEQFNFVLSGRFKYRVVDAEGVAGPGELIYIPANAQHYVVAVGDEDGSYLAVKDTSYYIAGEAVDGLRSGAHYDPGFEPKAG